MTLSVYPAEHVSLSRNSLASITIAILFCLPSGILWAEPRQNVSGYFSSWSEVPKLIDSINWQNYQDSLERLHELTRIELGNADYASEMSLNDPEAVVRYIKQRWKCWWDSTGRDVSRMKEEEAKIDSEAFQMAWDFLGRKEDKPKEILPIWIPNNWTLYLTFWRGSRERELWIIDRKATTASLTKMRKELLLGIGFQTERFLEYKSITPGYTDKVLKALRYVHEYALVETETKLPYFFSHMPSATLQLRDNKDRLLWNTEGSRFSKLIQKGGNGEAGRSHMFLKSIFPENNWQEVSKPTREHFDPYHKFLFQAKPGHSSEASDVVVALFGRYGGSAEIRAMLDWAEKHESATNPEMHWTQLIGDFSTVHKSSFLHSTRFDLEQTYKAIMRTGLGLQSRGKVGLATTADFMRLRHLKNRILESEKARAEERKREAKAKIQKLPQPIRDLKMVAEFSNRYHYNAAIQKVRKNPDPILFKQLIKDIDESILSSSILSDVILNDSGVEDWGEEEESRAINACIDGLPLAKGGARANLIYILLKYFGGGKIEVEDESGGRSVEVKMPGGTTFGGASHPHSVEEVQRELRRLYQASGKSSAKK